MEYLLSGIYVSDWLYYLCCWIYPQLFHKQTIYGNSSHTLCNYNLKRHGLSRKLSSISSVKQFVKDLIPFESIYIKTSVKYPNNLPISELAELVETFNPAELFKAIQSFNIMTHHDINSRLRSNISPSIYLRNMNDCC